MSASLVVRDRLLFATCNPAVRAKVLLCAVALVLGASVGWSQPAPDTILLPDSLGPIRPPYHLAFGSSTDNIYVASESSDIIVVDGSYTGNFQRIKRINTGTPVGGVLLVSQHNKLYCSYPLLGRVGVIDCATNDVVGSIQVGTRPTLLCYSSGSDKLYCGDTIDRTVTAIDCATNAVLGVISVGQGLIAMVYDPTTDKVYAGTKDALLAISCSTDTIAATISSIKWARSFCVNQRRQKLYMAAGYDRPIPDTIYVVSTQFDSVIGAQSCNGTSLSGLACNETTDRLYGVTCSGYTFVYEFDCAADTLIRFRDIGLDRMVLDLVCDTVYNRLYCLLTVFVSAYLYDVDCTTLSVTSKFLLEPLPGVLAFDPIRYRVMCTGWAYNYGFGAVLDVFDYKHGTTYARGAVPLSGWRGFMSHGPAAGKLYCRWGSAEGGVAVIDERTNRVVTQSFLSLARGSARMAYSRTSDKFYFHSQDGLGVMDGSTGRLLKVISIGDVYWSFFPCWSPVGNKVYCFATSGQGARNYIAVVDCNTDSVVREMDVYDLVRGFEYLGKGRMYCNYGTGLALIDCRTDSVLVDSAIEGYHMVTPAGDGEKFYAVLNRRLEVRSSSTLSLLSAIDWPSAYEPLAGTLVCSDATQKLYWFGWDSVLAIDATSDTVVARLNDSIAYERACLDHTGRYLFCASYSDRNLRVYDTQSDSLIAVYMDLPDPPVCITPNPEQGCIYVGCRDVILVYPDVPPGVAEAMSAERGAMNVGPSIVRGVLLLPPSRLSLPPTSLLSADGRKVLDLRAGANDVRALAPGVYFVRAVSREPLAGSCQKVVVTR